MRVLLVHDYGTPTGGAELQVLALRRGLRARGHEVRLFASRASLTTGQAGAAFEADAGCFGTTVGRLQAVSRTANPSAVWGLRRELRAFRPDVVHVRMYREQLSPLILSALSRVPVLYHAATYEAICPVGTKLLPDGSACRDPAGRACLRHRCLTPQSWVLAMGQRGLARRWDASIDAVAALSHAARRRLEAGGLDAEIEVLPNGVPGRPARPPLTGPPLVAFAGRLVVPKGVDVLLRAFAAAVGAAGPAAGPADPGLAGARPDRGLADARLLVAGHGPEAGRLAALAQRLGLTGRVELTGHLDRAEVERRFDAAWVQAVPGRWEEPFGNVVTEAMVRGTAVVASAVGGPAEVVRDGVTGTLVPPGDVPALAAALRRVLGDRDLAERWGAAGREVALKEYTEDLALDRIERRYRALVAGDRRRAASPAPAPGGPQ